MKVNGLVDSNTAQEIDTALSQLLRDNSNKIVLDLHGVGFFSTGLRTMGKALREARNLGGNVHLAAASGPVEMILGTVGMLQMVRMFCTSEEAATEIDR